MKDATIKNHKNHTESRARDHMANERTFLAWIRTSIGIMAFGFVVEKFTLFIKELAPYLALRSSSIAPASNPNLTFSHGYSSIFGEALLILGVIICLLAFLKFKKVEKEIESENYNPSALLDIMVTLALISIGLFSIVYLNSRI
jgi:uncharacterized membrane protein YidH (DUF202 family)